MFEVLNIIREKNTYPNIQYTHTSKGEKPVGGV